jgi:hypothetical protein
MTSDNRSGPDPRILLDPVKVEWVIVRLEGTITHFREHKDFKSNLDAAKAYLAEVDGDAE